MATRAAGRGEAAGGPAWLARVDAGLLRAVGARPFGLPWTIGAGVALLGYLWVFAATTDLSPFGNLFTSVVNVGAAWLLGFPVARAVERWIARGRPAAQLLGHLLLAVAFSVGWYVLTITALAWRGGGLTTGATILPFRGIAFAWQIFQGFALYGAAAALATAAIRRAPAPNEASAAPPGPAPLPASDRLLVRDGDEIRAVDVDDIILIAAADDYAEVVTPTRRWLARRTLGEFEAELPSVFVRVHRSTLVNLNKLERAEPAGAGRMTLHLAGGESVVASRTGARLIRERSA